MNDCSIKPHQSVPVLELVFLFTLTPTSHLCSKHRLDHNTSFQGPLRGHVPVVRNHSSNGKRPGLRVDLREPAVECRCRRCPVSCACAIRYEEELTVCCFVQREWNFDHREGCFPTAAIWDGKQTPAGSEYISANNEVIYTGCGLTTNTNKAYPFLTYYCIEKCEYSKSDGFKFKEYHVMYNVLFPYVSPCPA